MVNAIVDALRQFGVNDVLMPCTPERVWKAIQRRGTQARVQREAAPHFADGAQPGSLRGRDGRSGQ